MPDIGGVNNPTGPAGTEVTGDQIVTEAEDYLGVPYVYGGTSPKGFDCSGLVQYVFAHYGINLPRTSEQMYADTKQTVVISADQAQPGDLVFFGGSGKGYNYDGTPTSPGHVGIITAAASGGQPAQMVNAPTTGEKVRVQPVVGAVGYRRVVGTIEAKTSSVATQSNPQQGQQTPQSLIIIPDVIINAFKSIDAAFGDFYKGMELFFQPSTWVRAGSGLMGMIFFIAGLFFLMREAHS